MFTIFKDHERRHYYLSTRTSTRILHSTLTDDYLKCATKKNKKTKNKQKNIQITLKLHFK